MLRFEAIFRQPASLIYANTNGFTKEMAFRWHDGISTLISCFFYHASIHTDTFTEHQVLAAPRLAFIAFISSPYFLYFWAW